MELLKGKRGSPTNFPGLKKATNTTVFDKVKNKAVKLEAGDKVIEGADLETDIVLLLVPERMHYDTDFEF